MTDLRIRLYQAMMWQRHRIRQARNRDEHPLRYLFFEISRRCNIHCLYCGSDCTIAERKDELTTEEWKGIIDQVAEDFDATKVMVAVTGGEPLLREGIYEIFAHLHQRGFPYGIVTNSTLLTPEAAKKIVACGMNSISLSMDSVPHINDRIRGKGTSQAVIDAISNLRNAGYTGILEILSTITKPCMPHLAEMQAFITDLGIKRWRVAPVMPLGRAAEKHDLLLDNDDVKALLDFVRAQRRLVNAPLRPEFGEEGYLGDRYEGLVRPYLCQCRAGINVAGIRYDGIIGACPEISQAFDQGDIRKERFKTVWEERYQEYRDRSWSKSLGPCKGCEQFKTCQGGALHLYDDTQTPTKRCFYKMVT